jgi:hypothetical protein
MTLLAMNTLKSLLQLEPGSWTDHARTSRIYVLEGKAKLSVK